MTCKQVRNKLIFYIEKSLPPDEQKAVEEHLQHCAKCAQDYEKLAKALQFIETEKQTEPNPYLWTRIKAKLDAPQAEKQPVFSGLLQPVILTLLVVLGIFLGIKLGNLYVQPNPVSNITMSSKSVDYEDIFFTSNDIEQTYFLFDTEFSNNQ